MHWLPYLASHSLLKLYLTHVAISAYAAFRSGHARLASYPLWVWNGHRFPSRTEYTQDALNSLSCSTNEQLMSQNLLAEEQDPVKEPSQDSRLYSRIVEEMYATI